MSLCDYSPAYIRAIAPYEPGKPTAELAREFGLAEERIVKLASNENPLGVSPSANHAMRALLDGLARYPDGNGFELKQALVARFAVAMENVVLGNGSNDVLELIARAFLAPGASAVYAQHAFAVYPISVLATGATGIAVPARDFGHDLPAMLAAIRPDTRMVFIANPNNPTGTFIGGAEIEAFMRQVPAQVVVVLDEAYTEYLEPQYRYDSVSWLKSYPNLVITRTFSKVYGLAGLRVGYALASAPVADLMNRVRQPFNVNTLSLAAATAALSDDAFVERSYQLNRLGMVQLVSAFDVMGLSYMPSFGNFVTVKVPSAQGVFQQLLRAGVIVRPIANYGLPDYLRVSIGLESENARFVQALREILRGLV